MLNPAPGAAGEAATSLVALEDGDLAWMLAGEPRERGGLRLPDGGVDRPAVLRYVRRVVAELRAAGRPSGAWMIVADGEVVGLCSYKRAPENGEVEIGYGIAAARRGRGHMTRAIALVLDRARLDPAVGALLAETAAANVASGRVLEKNGFVRAGGRTDAEDGAIVVWRAELEDG